MFALNQTPLDISAQAEPVAATATTTTTATLAANGAAEANINSFAANQTAVMPPPEVPAESRAPEATPSSSDNLDSSEQPDSSNATPAELPQVSGPAVDWSADSVQEAAIDTSVEDTFALTSVPPVIDSQESDIRDLAPPAPAAPAETKPELPPTTQDSQTNGVLPAPVETSANTSTLDSNASSDPALSQLTIKEEAPAQSITAGELPNPSTDLNSDVVMHTESALPPATAPVPAAEQTDTEMADSSFTFTKVAREREDDDMEIEPSAKRTKTDDEGDSQEQAAPGTPSTPQSAEPVPVKPDTNTITPHETKEIIKVLKNVLRTNDGKNFRAPVSVLWPNFAEAYNAKVPNPVHLGAIETKVRDGQYPTWGAFRADVQLIADNALLFNGENHLITKAGEAVRNSIITKTAGIPAEPVVVPKIARKPAKRSTPQAESTPRAAARRPSRSAGSGPAAGTTSQTFALDPSTSTPLIRRDSTKGEGGRPKREIHPPKNKDLPYSVRPKSRKFAAEMKFCEDTLNEMKKPKHAAFASAFYVPVDPVALNIPNYFTTIKNPMDLSTVTKKLQAGDYPRAKDFEADVRLIFSNCYKFNPVGNPVREMGKKLEAVFEEKWSVKQSWVADNTAAAHSASPSGSEDEESDEEEEAEQVVQSTAAAALAQRLIEEQTKLITLMSAKNPDQAMIQMQQDLVALVQSRVDQSAKTIAAAGKKAPKKQKAPKGAKKPASKKAAGGASKKGGASRQRYLGTLEKETISAGLASLPDDVAESVLEMIKNDKPDVDVSRNGQLTLYD